MISKVFISKVRSLESMDCNFDAHINVICGPNGCGKTTILESIFRENGESLKSPTAFFGTCPAVIMQPSDIELLRGGPDVRRHWLDEILCFRSSANSLVLRNYKRVLQQRNKWLKEFKQKGSAVGGEDLFRVLTQQLIDLGAKLWAARIALSKEVSEIITRYYRKLSGGVDEITCAYKSSILKTLDALDAADPLSDEMMDEFPAGAMSASGECAECFADGSGMRLRESLRIWNLWNACRE